jgi:hypothetical protein
MKWFRCLIEGRDFPGILIGEESSIGFYTTRFVEAETPEDAELNVLASLKNDKSLELPVDHPKPVNAKVFFEEITLVDFSEVPERCSGFTFYVMET